MADQPQPAPGGGPAPLPEEEQAIIDQFVTSYFDAAGAGAGDDLDPAEAAVIDAVIAEIDARIGDHTFILGMAVDFTVVAEQLSEQDAELETFDADRTRDWILDRFELKPGAGGGDPNTLSLRLDDGHRWRGIRGVENKVVDLFHELDRTGYPSAAPHNTGQWRRFPELMSSCFKLSRGGRQVLVRRLLDYGARALERNVFFGPQERVRLFEPIITAYPRRGPHENAGLTFQAIAYGFISADRPHLDLVADKVRTGSARQKRFGDIDCYRGLEPALSVEVKDGHLTIDDYLPQFGRFVRNREASGVYAIAFIDTATDELVERLRERGVIVLLTTDVLDIVRTWDWPKQDAAVSAMLHYLSHVEQNSTAANRLLRFIEERDPGHDSLRYLEAPADEDVDAAEDDDEDAEAADAEE